MSFFIFLALFGSIFSYAAENEKVNSYDQVKKIYKSYEKAKSNVEKNEITARKVMGTLYRIKNRIRKISMRRDRLSAEVNFLSGNIKNYSQQLKELESKILAKNGQLGKRLRAMYSLDNNNMMNILFSSLSEEDLSKVMFYLKKISDSDIQLLKSYQVDKKQYAKKKWNLKKKITHMESLKIKIFEQEKLLKKDSFTKKVLLSRLKKEKSKFLDELYRIKSAGRDIGLQSDEMSLSKLFKEAFFEKRGHLRPPVLGSVQIPFGMYKDEIYQYKLHQKGIFLSTQRGSRIRPVHSGRVSFLGNINGYGMTLIIDHGDNYYTVYAGLEGIESKVGDLVKSSDIMAYTSYLPALKNYGLYFEIRHFSEALNPHEWIKQLNGKI